MITCSQVTFAMARGVKMNWILQKKS